MKKLLKPIIFAAVLALLYAGYALFGGRIVNSVTTRSARQAREAGDPERAARLYEQVLETSPRDETLRLLISDLYREAGNFSRAEYVLFTGLRDVGPSVKLYKKLCAVYVEQDKLYDAVELLDNIKSPGARGEIEAARPRPPTFSLPGGRYEERLGVSLLAGTDDAVYVSWTGGIPSASSGPLNDTVYLLSPGVTAARAVAVGADGLVSVWAECEYLLENIIDPVIFADSAVELLLRNALGRPDGLLYTSDLWYISELAAPDPADYQTLDDLLYCPALQTLTLTGNGGRCDISALPRLTGLTGLSLTEFGLDSMDLETVGECANLERLYLPGNNIGSVSPLEGLEHLEYLNLAGNSVLDVGPLGRLGSLRALRLTQNAVEDLGGLAPLSNLRSLYADENRITTLKGLESLTSLEVLEVSYNLGLTSISETSGLTSLTVLNASHCQIEMLPNLTKLLRLEELRLDSNRIADLAGLAGLPSLRLFSCPINSVTSLEPLSGCAALETVDVSRNGIDSVEPLGGLPALRSVNVEYNILKTVLPLKDCPSIKEIWAHGNVLTDPLDAWKGTGVAVQRS